MANEIELFLEKDGFYAGRKMKNGKMAAGSHKITEDEIIIMFASLLRVFAKKTDGDTMVVQGDDGMAMIAKLVPLKKAEQPAEAEQPKKAKQPAKAKQAKKPTKAKKVALK